MIASSLPIKVVCVVVATLVVIGATAVNHAPAPVVAQQGGADAIQARMGSSFEDMAIGTLSAIAPQSFAPVAPVPALQAAEVVVATITPQPVAPAPLPAPVLEKLVPTPAPEASPNRSSRPRQRDPVLAALAAPKQKTPARTAPKGNAARANTNGVPTGANSANASTQGAPRQDSQTGSAAASTYPGEVMRRISRVSKPRVNSRGTAVVAFSISGSGGLAALSITRSSGSASLDSVALGVIRKAAPFPAPPRGAQRSFSINIKGR
jgi:protein TonB